MEPGLTTRLPRVPDPVGATPLTDEDLDGLLPGDLATMQALDRDRDDVGELLAFARG